MMQCKPIMKWAGGKTQLLKELIPRIPNYPGKYIEPFFGGGALFFALQPKKAIISDSNPEIINVYKQIVSSIEVVIDKLKRYENTEEMFYKVRSQDWEKLSLEKAAARTIYLNKTCFNGLYRVNRKGQFNTPYGRYKNPTICNEEQLRLASDILKNAKIICNDYIKILDEFAEKGDFIYLDPPYVPVSKWSDFKRYTKEQFYEDDQRRLADEVKKLQKIGCYIIITNSNHPLIHSLYENFKIEIVNTRRAISSKVDSRTGEDVIITCFPT